jgi:hypothetical protein
MDTGDVCVRIGPRGSDGYRLLVRTFPVTAPPIEYETNAGFGTGTEMAGQIAAAIRDGVRRAWDAGELLRDSWPYRLLLEIIPEELFSTRWESLIPAAYAPNYLAVSRFRDASDAYVFRGFELPAQLLTVVDPANHDSTAGPRSRYYRQHRVTGIRDADLARTIRSHHFDIVHLNVGFASSPARKNRRLTIETEISTFDGFDARTLARPLRTSATRLLVLECSTSEAFDAALDVAHRLLRSGGPTTLLTLGASGNFWDDIYIGIVHDTPIDTLLFTGRGVTYALFHAIGGERCLGIKPLATHLMKRVENSLTTNANLVEDLKNSRFEQFPRLRGLFDSARLGLEEHTAAANVIFNYARETGAWEPLPDYIHAQDARAREIERLQSELDRVLNVGILLDNVPLKPTQALVPNGEYQLFVQIGRSTTWNVIRDAIRFPEAWMTAEEAKDGASLRVVVFAASFALDRAEQNLFLLSAPAASDKLVFHLRAPEAAGEHRIRVCVYHEMNLLQSVLVRVTVSDAPATRAGQPAIRAEVEYALSATFADVTRFPKREASILLNETDAGTHTVAVVGKNLATSFDLGENEMQTALDEARQTLYAIAAQGKPPVYRFDKNNAATVKQLEQDTVQLATIGYRLYADIVTRRDRTFKNDLQNALGPSGAHIQIASVKSARYVFPWTLVYDHPLVVGNLKLCPQFASDVGSHTALENQACLTRGCPNQANYDIVCPSGFWGFKHIIEQPLSVSADSNASGKRDLVLEIRGTPGPDLSALMVVSRDSRLTQVATHENELRSSRTFSFSVKDNKAEAGQYLKDPTLSANLVYFYCHGMRENKKAWLGIGKEDKLVPSDLSGFDIDWTDTHPLVFINGCHTVDFSPDDMLPFNQAFAWCRAAGVVGTEISVTEDLARDFARGFITRFYNGESVGTILRTERLDLLRRCNLLGLAYTPYCSADLKIVHP